MSKARPVAYLLIALLFAQTSGASALRHLSSLSLPDGMTARDVRWASASEVYLAAGREGIVRVRLDGSPARGKTVTAAEGVRSPIAGMVGAGNAHVLYGSQMGAVGWVPLTGAGKKAGDKGLLTVVDLDAWNDTAVILGADSGPVQGLARDGAIAWVGSFSKNLTDLRPIMKGRSKPGGKDMARCGILETGRARFMRDGSVVIAPGVEPGLFRYDRDGILTADGRGIARATFPEGLPEGARLAAYAGGSWAFDRLRRVGGDADPQQGTLRMTPPALLTVRSRSLSGSVRIVSSQSGDLTWMLERVGTPLTVGPESVLVVPGLPGGTYEVSLANQAVTVSLTSGSTATATLP